MESLTGIGTTRNPALARWLAGLAAGAILWLTACSQLDAFADALSAVPLFIGFLAAGVPLGVTFSFLISAPLVNEVALVLLAEKGAQADVDRHLRRGRRQRHPAGRLRLQLAAVMRLPIRRRFRLAASGACLRLICVLVLATASSLLTAAASPSSPSSSTASFPWIEANAAGERQVHLYFFWTSSCPHCQAARPFVEALPARHPWLLLHSRNLSGDREAVADYVALAASVGEEASSVPAFLFCGRMEVGFDRAETTGRALEEALQACRDAGEMASATAAATGARVPGIDLPLVGRIAPEEWSLPVFTLLIAALDAFNPCAFFVLLFLLSLLIHAGSRTRMLFIGSVFLFFSGLIYFLFMAAWLNVFRWLGEIALVTTVAGVLAIVIALLNIKDYFWFGAGPSLSIPEAAKPGLYRRMRGLLRAESLPALTLGTIALAIAANSYELLCTAGFPMVYTRLLTLSDLPSWQHYAYLAFYNLVYVIPLLLITLVFTCTLGSRKLSAAEGRLLKLLSGVMMLGLGGLLVVAPAALNDLRVALALVAGAIGVSWLVHRLRPRNSDAAG